MVIWLGFNIIKVKPDSQGQIPRIQFGVNADVIRNPRTNPEYMICAGAAMYYTTSLKSEANLFVNPSNGISSY